MWRDLIDPSAALNELCIYLCKKLEYERLQQFFNVIQIYSMLNDGNVNCRKSLIANQI